MMKSAVLERLRAHRAELRGLGVAHAMVFGSIGRGEEQTANDVDIAVELDPEANVDVYRYVGIKEYLSGLFEEPVDVVNADGLKPHLREALTDAARAF